MNLGEIREEFCIFVYNRYIIFIIDYREKVKVLIEYLRIEGFIYVVR